MKKQRSNMTVKIYVAKVRKLKARLKKIVQLENADNLALAGTYSLEGRHVVRWFWLSRGIHHRSCLVVGK